MTKKNFFSFSFCPKYFLLISITHFVLPLPSLLSKFVGNTEFMDEVAWALIWLLPNWASQVDLNMTEERILDLGMTEEIILDIMEKEYWIRYDRGKNTRYNRKRILDLGMTEERILDIIEKEYWIRVCKNTRYNRERILDMTQ